MEYTREYVREKLSMGLSRQNVLASFQVSPSSRLFEEGLKSDDSLVNSIIQWMLHAEEQSQVLQWLCKTFRLVVALRSGKRRASRQNEHGETAKRPKSEVQSEHGCSRDKEIPVPLAKHNGSLTAEGVLADLCRLHSARGAHRQVELHARTPSMKDLLGADMIIVLGCRHAELEACAELHGLHVAYFPSLESFSDLVGHYKSISVLDPPDVDALMLAETSIEVRRAIECRAELDFRGTHGRTPLHAAAANGSLEVTHSLLDLGASWAKVDDRGHTAAELALACGHREVFDLLVSFAGDEELDQCQGGNRCLGAPTDFLSRPVKYEDGLLLAWDGSPVMMGWEAPLMRASAEKLNPEGKHVLNVGFGMGLIDSALEAFRPAHHTIVEAHPDVLQEMRARGWYAKSQTTIREGRWEDVQLERFDAIFYDTYAESYEDRRAFHQRLPELLRPGGRYSYFNGGHSHNIFWHAVSCYMAMVELQQLGIALEFTRMTAESNWAEFSGWYWQFPFYLLPLARHLDPSEARQDGTDLAHRIPLEPADAKFSSLIHTCSGSA